jgi:hypothetical protein
MDSLGEFKESRKELEEVDRSELERIEGGILAAVVFPTYTTLPPPRPGLLLPD